MFLPTDYWAEQKTLLTWRLSGGLPIVTAFIMLSSSPPTRECFRHWWPSLMARATYISLTLSDFVRCIYAPSAVFKNVAILNLYWYGVNTLLSFE